MVRYRSRRRLGANIEVSRIAWGMWRFGGESLQASRNLVEVALDCEIDFFDTADIYGAVVGQSEEMLGRILAEAPGLRQRIVIATKGGIDETAPYDSSPQYLEAACERSLRRLGVETIDLYQIHRPDLLSHPEQLAAALTRLVRAGKVREIGVSNFTVPQVEALQTFMPFPLASIQPEFSVFEIGNLDDGVLDQAMRRALLPLAWSPLGGGRIGQPGSEREARIVTVIDQIAEEIGATREGVALAWILAHPAGIVPIIGSQVENRIRSAVTALTLDLSRRHWYDVLVASRGEPMP